MSVGQSTTLVLKYIATGWILTTFYTNIHGTDESKRLHLTFPVAPPGGQSFCLSCEIAQHLTDGLSDTKLGTDIHVPQQMNCNNFILKIK